MFLKIISHHHTHSPPTLFVRFFTLYMHTYLCNAHFIWACLFSQHCCHCFPLQYSHRIRTQFFAIHHHDDSTAPSLSSPSHHYTINVPAWSRLHPPSLFCSLHVVFSSLLNVSSAPIPHAQSYTPLQENFICSFTDSSRPDPCSLPRTCHLLVLRFLPPRAMLPSVDMLSTSPPLPPTAFTATITPHTLLFVFALRLGTINTTRNAMTTQ